LLVLAIRPQGLFGKKVSCRERRRPHPVDQSITVKRHQIPVAYTLAGAIVLVVFFTWAPWILPASDVSILMNFFILVIMATMWNLLAGYAGMVSIGQQAFIGLGAYATLYFAIKGMDPSSQFRSR